MARRDIDTIWDRETRNNINENFKELYNEYIGAGLDAKEAKQKAEQALNIANQSKQQSQRAEDKADSVQKQLNQVVIEGDSSVEAAQARVDSEGNTYSTLKERLDDKETGFSSRLTQKEKEIGISVWKYENLIPNKATATNENEWDWTQSIKTAIQEAYETGVSVVLFPHYGTGEYLTDPISFQGYKGIVLKGIGAQIDLNLPYSWGSENQPTKHVRLKFKTSGEVGLQFSDTTNPSPTWNAPSCRVENLWVCGNNLVDTCINGNYGLTLKNVHVSHALYDGVVFEDFTYPALIADSQLGPNGRHGLFVKGPMTTVFTLRRVNASLNGGYGYYLIGGSGANFDDCLAQSNSQGGLKITKRNDLYGTLTNNFLDKLTFNNFYSEANGKLSPTDPNYEGNYALVIDATTGTNATGQIEVRNIRFNDGALNHSTDGGSYNIQRVVGLTFNGLSVNHSKGTIKVGESFGVDVGISATKASATAPYPFINKYLDRNQDTPFLIHKGGLMTERGRVISVPFIVDSIDANTSKAMRLANGEQNNEWITHGYPLAKGSIVGVKLINTKSKKTDSTVNGNISVSLTSNKFEDESNAMPYLAQNILTINLLSERYKEIWFEYFKYPISNGFVGLRLKASSDYANSVSYPSIMAYLLVEC